MKVEDLFASAREAVLGNPPSCAIAMIGYNMSSNYFGNLIEEAESVLQNIKMPRDSLPLYLDQAFQFSSYGMFRQFPKEAQNIIISATDNFRARYEPLLKRLETISPSAA